MVPGSRQPENKHVTQQIFALTRCLLIFGSMSLGSIAAAQEYQADPSIEDKARMNRLTAQQCLKNPATYAAEKAKFEDFFSGYYFPAMTRPTPEALAELGKLRYELFQRYLWATSNEQLQAHLTELARVAMGRIIQNRTVDGKSISYHPAVRYNATLVIGMLDQQYAIENRRPPKPLPQATKVLTFIVDKATAGDQFPPPVILGALIGLERHAEYRDALEPGAADAMTAALLKLVNQEQPIQEMDREAYSWFRLRAASALAQLGNAGPNGEVHAALIKLIAGSKSLDDRTAAAGLLAKIKYEGAKIDGPATLEGMLKLARDVGAAEAKRAREFEEAAVGLGGVGSARGQFANPLGEPEGFPRRQVLARLADLRRGLRAVKPVLAEDARRGQIDAIDKAIGPVITATADSSLGDLKITEAIRMMAEAIAREVPSAEPEVTAKEPEPVAAEEKPSPAETPAEAPDATETPVPVPTEEPASAEAPEAPEAPPREQ